MSQTQRACIASVDFLRVLCEINASIAFDISRSKTLCLILLVLSNESCLDTRCQHILPILPVPFRRLESRTPRRQNACHSKHLSSPRAASACHLSSYTQPDVKSLPRRDIYKSPSQDGHAARPRAPSDKLRSKGKLKTTIDVIMAVKSPICRSRTVPECTPQTWIRV